MERLMYELAVLNVSHVWVESRSPRQDRDDVTLFAALHSSGVMPDTMHAEHAYPDVEPMLWLPDAVAGAVGMHHRGMGSQPYEALAARVTIHTITLH